MIYTHCWVRKEEINAQSFQQIKADFERLLPHLIAQGIVFGDEDGPCDPLIQEEAIEFNGAGVDSYERFSFHRISQGKKRLPQGCCWDFCKTNQRPYGLAVAAFLLIAQHHLPHDLRIESDGNPSGWKQAGDLCRQVLNISNPFAS